ncbi:RRP12-like protein [Cephus cinctus]|uniref:RRP12-like protein n=1 Tax=Cephus cinctus TaxID=211228 RepID=A0AAJ7R8Z3_CEPCN|nr:RRP12-like protein [Cephus cinctus]
MGKFGPRLASRKKAKRWVKGQSSSSNPETKKHREQARSRFFQENLGSTGLTTNVLKKHDAIQGVQHVERIEVDDEESTVAGSFNTFDTFASDWSDCSNVSFSRFLTRFQSSSLVHKEMLAVLAAITEVIKQNGGTESSTEYYAALMTALEAAETDESVAAILSLLAMGLKTVPKNVIRVQFSQASQILLQILTKYATSESFLILRTCIGCLSLLLRAQEAAVWSNSSTIQVLDAVLAFTVHAKPKVRKAAQHAVCAILKGSDIMRTDDPPTYHPGASQTAKHCLAQLEAAGQPGGITSTLHTLTLLKDICHQLPKSYVKSVCEGLLRIMTLNNVLVTSCCLQTFHGLFISRPSESILPAQLNAQIINALYDYQPAPGDTQPTLAWLAVMQEAYCNLVLLSLPLCAANITRILEKCTELWLSDKSEVLSGASHTIKTLLQVCITPLCATQEDANKYKTTLIKTIQLIQQGMKYQYNSAWHHVLHLLAVIFQITGHFCKDELLDILTALAELRDSYKFIYNAEVEYAVGAAVRTMGPEIVLRTIPLQTGSDIIDLNRSWLLPVLKDCISNASLSYFIQSLLPLATMCERKSAALKANNDGIGAHSYELLTSQIWALLPSFCNNPTDIKDSFKSIARILGMAIAERKALRLSVMASLRKLVAKATENNNAEDIAELARFAKNYLPLLFNLYTTKPNGSDEEGQRLAALDTIRVYLSITSNDIVGELFDRAMGRLNDPQIDSFLKESVYDLIRILTPHTEKERLKALYEKCIPVLMDTKNQKEQKKSYRLLEEICGSESDVCKQFRLENRKAIQKALVKAQNTTVTTSKNARLRCLSHIVKNHPQLEKTKLLRAIVPEAVMCIKELNDKCRTSAYQLLNIIADKLLSNTEHFKEYIDILVSGLAGAPIFCSATLLALASITYNYNGSLGVKTVHEILEHACVLLSAPTREIVISALSFIKVYITVMPSPTVAPTLPAIMKASSKMTEDCKRHFRLKIRDILVKLVRKYGIDTITAMVPVSDEVMHKRLKNIRKIQTRKQKAKEQKKAQQGEEDSDEEFNVKSKPKSIEEILADSDEEEFDEDMETDQPDKGKKRKSQKKTWIQEDEDNIVNFVDPAAAKSITATLPKPVMPGPSKQKVKNHGFKTAPDGRLIIKDNDSDSDNNDSKKSKKKLPFLGSDSDDDFEDEETKSIISAATAERKRRHSGSTDAASTSTRPPLKYQAGGSGIHRPIQNIKKDNTFGSEYRAKKAKGDIKKKGKPEPYAYVPLTRAALNKRKKMKNAGRFKNIISGAKKGARAGIKINGKHK